MAAGGELSSARLLRLKLSVRRLDEYELLHEIGEGYFGRVYKAQHRKSGKYVAMKEIKENKYISAEEIPKDLNHENVIKIICRCVEHRPNGAEVSYVVMELCDRSLKEHMENINGTLSDELQHQFRLDVIQGLVYLHSIKTVHRDIKPDNVLLSINGSKITCKLSDFGLAKMLDIAQSYMRTKIGNPYWVAPELFDPSGKYWDSIDIWSSGKVILYLSVDFKNRRFVSHHTCK